MFRFTIRDVLWLMVVVGLPSLAVTQKPREPPIKAASLGRNVVGHLGYPHGTVLRVTGTCIDGDTTGRKADVGKTLLNIDSVNGKTLTPPAIFPFERSAKGIAKPSPGDMFDYYVHEWGTFDGIVEMPKGLGIDRPTVANDGFAYRPQITVHKDNRAK